MVVEEVGCHYPEACTSGKGSVTTSSKPDILSVAIPADVAECPVLSTLHDFLGPQKDGVHRGEAKA